MNPTLVLLAAGMSTRYGRLKQLEPVGPDGEALLDYAVFDAYQNGFRRVVLIVRQELEAAFRAHSEPHWPGGLEVCYHHQKLDDLPGVEPSVLAAPAVKNALSARTKPWGTAHALLTARALLDGPFILLNADDYYGPSAFSKARKILKTLEAGLESSPGATVGERSKRRPDAFEICLMTYTLRSTLSEHGGVSRGICKVDPEGWLNGVREVLEIRMEGGALQGVTLDGERLKLTGSESVSTNFWVFAPAVFALLEESLPAFLQQAGEVGPTVQPEFLIPGVVNEALMASRIRVRCHPVSDRFLGITHPADRAGVAEGLRDLAEAGTYPRPLWGDAETRR